MDLGRVLNHDPQALQQLMALIDALESTSPTATGETYTPTAAPSPQVFPFNTTLPSYNLLLPEGKNPAVSNVGQLRLGFNSLLGLTAYEQQGAYMRNAIWEFHLDPNNVYLMLQGQSGYNYQQFSTPRYVQTR